MVATSGSRINYYKKANPKYSLNQAYSQFLRNAVYGKPKYDEMISKHTTAIFEALKNERDLWDANNPNSYLNYNSTAIKCISNNMQDKALKTTFNALISTNSMTPKLFGTPVSNKNGNGIKDKYLASYIALDFYYAKLFGIDFTKINFSKAETPVDFNKLPAKQSPSNHSHDDHNHSHDGHTHE